MRIVAARCVLVLALLASPALVASFAKGPKRTSKRRRKNSSSSGSPRSKTPRGAGARRAPARVPTGSRPDSKIATLLDALYDEGMALLREESYEEAGLVFERVIDTDPDAADAWAALGVVMVELDQREAALSCQKQVMRIRGIATAGSASAYNEQNFETLADAELPPLPDGRRLSLALGSLDRCSTGGRVFGASNGSRSASGSPARRI